MANNRMVLVCNVCNPVPNAWSYKDKKGVLIIAKWYPGGPYYRNNNDTMGQEFEYFLKEHNHDELPSKHYKKGAGQENPIRLEYESEGLPVLNKK